MEQKRRLSRITTIIIGVMFLIMGVITLTLKLNMLGSILLIVIGITGIAGAILGKFEDYEQNQS